MFREDIAQLWLPEGQEEAWLVGQEVSGAWFSEGDLDFSLSGKNAK